MNPAPDTDSTITMPSPHRVVTRSLSLLEAAGYTRRDALYVVWYTARHAWADLRAIGVIELSWLVAIWEDAEARPGFVPPHPTSREDKDNGGETRPGQQASPGQTAGETR